MPERTERLVLPVLPLREVVLFPGTTAPIGAGRPGTLRAIEAALNTPDRLIFAVSQRENLEQVDPEGLYTIGTIARIGQMQRGLAGMQLLLHGEKRGIAIHVGDKNGYLESIVREAEEMSPLNAEDPAFIALYREARTRAAELGQKSGLPEEVVQQVQAELGERQREMFLREQLPAGAARGDRSSPRERGGSRRLRGDPRGRRAR